MAKLSDKKKVLVCIEATENDDCKKISLELTKKIKKKIQHPTFMLVFSTIHYEDKMDEILTNLKKEFNKVPLVGGTVAGFMTSENFYAKGVAVFALFYPSMDAGAGIGNNTKKDPGKSAEKFSEFIKKKLKDSPYKNKFIINLVSAPTIPKLPFVGRINVIRSKILGTILANIVPFFSFFGQGIGKEEDVIKYLGEFMPDYHIIGGSTIDNINYLKNFQFFGNKIVTNSIVGLGVKTDLDVFLESIINISHTNKSALITGSSFSDRIINTLNNKPAKKELLNLLEVPEEMFNKSEAFYYKTSDYFPISFIDNPQYTSGIAGIFGDNIILGYKAMGKRLEVCHITGKEILDSISVFLKKIEGSLSLFPFFLFFSSGIKMNILGKNIVEVKSLLNENLGHTPYLLLYTINENFGEPGKQAIARVYSFNAFSLKRGAD